MESLNDNKKYYEEQVFQKFMNFHMNLYENDTSIEGEKEIEDFLNLKNSGKIADIELAELIITLYQFHKFNNKEIIEPYLKKLGLTKNLHFFLKLEDFKKTIDEINKTETIYISPCIIVGISIYLNSKIIDEVLNSLGLISKSVRNSKKNKSKYNLYSATAINLNRSIGKKTDAQKIKNIIKIFESILGEKEFKTLEEKYFQGKPNQIAEIQSLFKFPNLIILKKSVPFNQITTLLAKLIAVFDPTMLLTEEEFNEQNFSHSSYNAYLHEKITRSFKINIKEEINRSPFAT